MDIGHICCGMGRRELLQTTREMFRSAEIQDSNPGTVDRAQLHIYHYHTNTGAFYRSVGSSTERFQIIDDRSHFCILKTFFLQMLSAERFILLVIFNKASCITSLEFHISNSIDDVLY